MSRDLINSICAAFPGAEVSDPWGGGHDAWKVGVKAPYFHRSWIRLPLDAPEDELRHRIASSYDTVRASLTKKLQAALPPRS